MVIVHDLDLNYIIFLETNYDGKNNVLVSTHPLPHVVKDGVLEVDEVEDGIRGEEGQSTFSIRIRYPDHKVISVVRVSRMLTLTKNPRQRKLYVESFCSSLQEQLRQDDRLSKIIVTVCNG